MPDDDTLNDDLQLDRLVDGELSADERRELLLSLDARENGWRRCALAFLESQTWGQELKQLVRPTSSPEVSRPSASQSGRSVKWLAVAAGLLLAFTIGMGLGERVFRIGPRATPAIEQLAGDSPDARIVDPSHPISPDRPIDAKVNRPDMLTVWVQDENGQPRPLGVPLVDAETVDRQLGVGFRPGVPQHVRSRLREQGYQVETKRRYAPLWIEQGQPVVFPVEDTRIVPVSREVY